MKTNKTKKEFQEEVRLYRNLANSTSRGMTRIKNEQLQDMKIQFKNLQDAVRKLQKENKKLRKKKIEVFIKKEKEGGYLIGCDRYDVYTQGETIVKAKKMFNEAFICYIEAMIGLGELFEYKINGIKKNENKTKIKSM